MLDIMESVAFYSVLVYAFSGIVFIVSLSAYDTKPFDALAIAGLVSIALSLITWFVSSSIAVFILR